MRRKKEIKEPLQEEDLPKIFGGIEAFIHTQAKEKDFLHTGNLALDYIISMKVDGTGGYPMGQIVEVFGEPSTGKSLLLAKALAEAQKKGLLAIVADAEGRWDDDFAAAQGMNIHEREIMQPTTVEEFAADTFNILIDAKKHNRRVAVVLDSLAILSTLKEVEDIGEGELKADQGRKAQRIRQTIRVLRSEIRDTNSILIVANHVIANPGSYINVKTTPGGGGVPFQSSVRIELTNPSKLVMEGKDRPIGVELHATVTKNSIAPPFGKCDMRLYWSSGVDRYSGLAKIMKDLGIVTQAGAWYEYKGDKFHAEDLGKFVEKHPEIMKEEAFEKPYFLE